jgi:hypothetical protein
LQDDYTRTIEPARAFAVESMPLFDLDNLEGMLCGLPYPKTRG